MKQRLFIHLKNDLPSSIVVFFVALPLCLGIALASNTPLFAGIIAGIIGGIVVGLASGSALGVSGPAAGLVAIVISSVESLGSWEAFLLAGVIAGVLQLIAGFLRGGIIAYYFPSAVIKGMLTGIGIIIILEQIPHLLGHDVTPLLTSNGELGISGIREALDYVNPGIVLISILSLLIFFLWEKVLTKKHKFFEIIQAPLVVVILGITLNWFYEHRLMEFALERSALVQLPKFSKISELFQYLTLPDFSLITNFAIYKVAIVIALIASLETLLCVEAVDKLDPHKRITPTDRELKAQGLGNIISCFIGGLPITQVIVRSSANVAFGAKTKLSTILHGFFLFICVVSIPEILNKIPLASLASILIIIGYKLAKPGLFKQMYKMGWEQFVPFIVTIVGIVFNHLLFGITLGFSVAIFIILRHHFLNSHDLIKIKARTKNQYLLKLAEEVSFLNKGSIINELKNIPEDTDVIIDGSKSKMIDHDIKEVIQNFILNAKTKNIKVKLIGI
ncbi:sulfate transporter [Legionella lansingensis]|uniref:Sulfate transporter n=1 Tax=Legionella lansingensis TaxID=45067 RepID=A0A0W0VR36_9GAMM|nr:SulP family inorganic anion transporter [Legionella lansingensis]KTD22651.1 sulfate transporter [Legionella lansingensis]SNV56069.1 sulfate transporter [Legionella lansingensis]